MEENSFTEEPKDKPKIFEYLKRYTNLRWLKEKDPRAFLWVIVSVLAVTLVALVAYLFLGLPGTDNDNDGGQGTGKYINFTTEDKENILRSLSDDHETNEMSLDDKHAGLDQLNGQVENDNNLDESEKLDVLKSLNQ